MIRLTAVEPFCVTALEYERIVNELHARHITGDVTLGDRILAQLLHDHRTRYNEIKDDVDADRCDDIDLETNDS